MTLFNNLSLKGEVGLFSRVDVLSEIMVQGMATCSHDP